MSDYRRYFVPGGTYFYTLVAFQRRPRFARPGDIQRLRHAVAFVQREQPFQFVAAVVLPDHMHFIWTLPPGDSYYSRRIGRMKVHFTRGCDMQRARTPGPRRASRGGWRWGSTIDRGAAVASEIDPCRATSPRSRESSANRNSLRGQCPPYTAGAVSAATTVPATAVSDKVTISAFMAATLS